jgi:signal transduction histidine kinase
VVSSLLAVLLLLYVWTAYRGIAGSSRMAMGERNIRVASDLAQLVGQNVLERRALVQRVANHAAVRSALKGGPTEPAESVAATLRGPIDTTLSIMLLDSTRRPVHYVGTLPSVETARRVDPILAQAEQADSMAVYSPLFVDGAFTRFWAVAAVRENGRLIGYLAHARIFGVTGDLARTFHSLIGENSAILFANTSQAQPVTVGLDGALAAAERNRGRNGAVERYERGDTSFIAGSDTIPGTPWRLVLETPMSVTRARANVFLERTALLSIALLLVGSVIVWLVSRRFVRPILELNEATQAIAARRFDQRVRVDRTDELGALATAFNHMAEEVQRSLREAEAAKAEAEQANRAKSEFLGAMSHEIRTPINAILGYTDLMELGVDGPLSDAQRARLERVRMSGQHLVSLVDDLLDFTRLETARITLHSRLTDAETSVRTALAVIDPQAAAKGVRIVVEVEPRARYYGDPKRVEQILINLLGNAVKFTATGGRVSLTCKVTKKNQETHTEFAVEDTGIGIPANRLETIFEPFVQVRGGLTRPHGGSGLGLTISRRLAEMMKGTITVESQEGVGSRFVLLLPPSAPKAGESHGS